MAKDDDTKDTGKEEQKAKGDAGAGDGDGDDEREATWGRLGDLIEERVDAALEKRLGSKDQRKPGEEKKGGGFLETIFG